MEYIYIILFFFKYIVLFHLLTYFNNAKKKLIFKLKIEDN